MTTEQKELVTASVESKVEEVKDYKKRITLLCLNGKSWVAEFDGLITPRDIKRLRRTLTVEYAKVRRRRSTMRLMQLHRKELVNTPKDKKDNSNDNTANTTE